MKQLWAPWRIEYILGEKSDECIFCAAAEKGLAEALVLHATETTVVLLNKYPYNNGHLMVAPVRHIADFEDLTEEESADLMRLVSHSIAALKKSMNPEGFNVGMNIGKSSGAGIEDHVHMHVVPRWQGDVNYMAVLASVRVLPEHISETSSKLRPYFNAL